MVMQNKKDLEELKELMKGATGDGLRVAGDGLRVAGDGLRVAGDGLRETAPTITISQPEVSARKPIEAEEIETEPSLRIEDAEIERIKRALEVSGGNRKVAADKLDISERTLYRKIKEYGL